MSTETKAKPAWLEEVLKKLNTPPAEEELVAWREAGRRMRAHRVKMTPGPTLEEMVREMRDAGDERD